MPVAEAQERIDSQEFDLWRAVDETMEPLGTTWQPLALMMSMLDSFFASWGKGGKGRPPAEFIPVRRSDEWEERRAERIARTMQSVAEASRGEG